MSPRIPSQRISADDAFDGETSRSSPPMSSGSISLALAFMASTILIVGALMGFVRLKSLQTEAGYRIHDQRQRLVTLEQQRLALEVERTALSRPARLAYLARTTLGLVPADVGATAIVDSPPSADDGVAPKEGANP